MAITLVTGLALAAGIVPGTLPRVQAASASPVAVQFPGCQAPSSGRLAVVVGLVTCVETPSRLLGGTTALSYFVPPGCAPDRGRRCPTLYLLHGFGGDYASMLGTAPAPAAWVAALERTPPTAPEDSAAPWTESDPSRWKPAPALDMVLVAPDGRTTPGGYGPGAGLEGYWADWNPR